MKRVRKRRTTKHGCSNKIKLKDASLDAPSKIKNALTKY
jgi:hypothetical protein